MRRSQRMAQWSIKKIDWLSAVMDLDIRIWVVNVFRQRRQNSCAEW